MGEVQAQLDKDQDGALEAKELMEEEIVRKGAERAIWTFRVVLALQEPHLWTAMTFIANRAAVVVPDGGGRGREGKKADSCQNGRR